MNSLSNPNQESVVKEKKYVICTIITLFCIQLVMSNYHLIVLYTNIWNDSQRHFFTDWIVIYTFGFAIFYLVVLILFIRKANFGWVLLTTISTVQVAKLGYAIGDLLYHRNLSTAIRFITINRIVYFIIFLTLLILLLSKQILSTYKITRKEKKLVIIYAVMIVIGMYVYANYFYYIWFKHN